MEHEIILEDVKGELAQAISEINSRLRAIKDNRLRKIEQAKKVAYTSILHSIIIKEESYKEVETDVEPSTTE